MVRGSPKFELRKQGAMGKAKEDQKDCIRIAWLAVTGESWPFEAEFAFAAKDEVPRKWRFDWASMRLGIAIEIEGVVFSGRGRHQSAVGMAKDCEKYNHATRCGWRVLRFTPQMVSKNPEECVGVILDVAELVRKSQD